MLVKQVYEMRLPCTPCTKKSNGKWHPCFLRGNELGQMPRIFPNPECIIQRFIHLSTAIGIAIGNKGRIGFMVRDSGSFLLFKFHDGVIMTIWVSWTNRCVRNPRADRSIKITNLAVACSRSQSEEHTSELQSLRHLV